MKDIQQRVTTISQRLSRKKIYSKDCPKNAFTRLYDTSKFDSLFGRIQLLMKGDLQPSDMLILKKDIVHYRETSSVSKDNLKFIEEYYSHSHSSFIIRYNHSIPEIGLLSEKRKHYTFLFLLRNLNQEDANRRSFRSLLKYIVRKIDSDYNKATL